MSILGMLGIGGDRGRRDDLHWFGKHPRRRHRARRMSAGERRQLRRGFRLDCIPLDEGFGWIVVTRLDGPGRISRIPAAWPRRVAPEGLPEEKARDLFEQAQKPLAEWAAAIGLRPKDAA